MTKTEYKFLRSQYRQRCKELRNALRERDRVEFCWTDKTLILYNALELELRDFAKLVGCSIPCAVDMLNLR